MYVVQTFFLFIFSYETLDRLRSEIATRIIKISRFWKEANIKRKLQKIKDVVREIFYDEFEKKKVFCFSLPQKLPNFMKRAELL